jgi:hypothetical protein
VQLEYVSSLSSAITMNSKRQQVLKDVAWFIYGQGPGQSGRDLLGNINILSHQIKAAKEQKTK